MRRKITKEEFKKVLDTLFPWGYTGNVENWDRDWFLGWAYINEDSVARDIMYINQDVGGITMCLVRCEEVTPETVTGAVDGMMHALLPGMVADDIFRDCNSTVTYLFPETDNEEPTMTDKQMIVRNIVQDILDNDSLDENEITDITLYDGGECIHVAFTGAVATSTFVAVGQAFGDDAPNVYSDGYKTIRLVISNIKHDELKG